MSRVPSREVRFASRPSGLPSIKNFTLVQTELGSLEDQEVMVRNLFMSVDPYMRGRMNDAVSYVPPFQIGRVLDGAAIGKVVESRSVDFKPGDIVTSDFGWREYFISQPVQLHKIIKPIQPISVYLGALGMTGMTAWVGLNLAEVAPGDVIFISGAAGAVGNVAGQLAKSRGCTVIGSAGTDEKVAFLKDKCGFDAAFNYKSGSIHTSLRTLAPEGIDVYFDNVGGETLEAALDVIREHGRIIECGAISRYNAETPQPGPSNLTNIVTKRLTIKGLIVTDWMKDQTRFEAEMTNHIRNGTVKNEETVIDGIDRAASAFLGLFEGKNTGKMVVRLASI